jgi:two-component system, chemotaxis family, response regulator PixH
MTGRIPVSSSEVTSGSPHRTKPLVLSVDDEPCIGRVVQLKLRNAGFDVERASSGVEGLEKFLELRPDVLITDVKMPGMSGIELCRRCEEYRASWPFLIIVLTSQLDEETRAWLEESEGRRYLPKPFSPREILRTIQEYLAERDEAVEPAPAGTREVKPADQTETCAVIALTDDVKADESLRDILMPLPRVKGVVL